MVHSKSNSIRKVRVIQVYLRKQEKYQICNLILYLSKLEKWEIKSKISRNVIKIRAEIDKISTKKKKTMRKSMKLIFEI